MYGRGFTVFKQGDRPEYVYLVRKGWIQVAHVTGSGRSVVDFLGPGTVLGIMEAVTDSRLPVSARTLEDCELELVRTEEFLDMLEKKPHLASGLLKTVSRYSQRILHYLYDVVGKVSSERRLLRALYEIALSCGATSGRGTQIRLPLTVQDIGDRIGCSRQWTSRLLGSLESRGILERRSGWLVITPDGMKLWGKAATAGTHKDDRPTA
jgi:CRP/FNR family transcriptional regulator, cyclic AMP receptor protein